MTQVRFLGLGGMLGVRRVGDISERGHRAQEEIQDKKLGCLRKHQSVQYG